MDEYMRSLKKYLMFECACVMSRCGKNGGIYEYVQQEFAYNSCKLDGCELSKKNVINMFESGLIYADTKEDMFRAEDIINIDGHFLALKYSIDECMMSMSCQDMKEIYSRLNCGRSMKVDRDMFNLTYRAPKSLREIAEFHVDWLKLNGDPKTARVVAFMQCLEADITPFIIHEENKSEYESRLTDPGRLEQFFKTEQMSFYRETEPMVIDQV